MAPCPRRCRCRSTPARNSHKARKCRGHSCNSRRDIPAAAEEAEEEEAEEEEETGEEIKVIDTKIEELVEGDLKLKEDESLPKDIPIKRKKKTK